MTIHGDEHFATALRRFSCYGHPIRHPLTRRIEGVLDVSAVVETANPLLQPLIARAVQDIEQRLLDGSRVSEKCLLAAFQEASGNRRRAVLAVGEDIVMCNQAASDLLSASDIALLRVLAEEPARREESVLSLTLTSGRAASVTVTRVEGARRGVLIGVEAFAIRPAPDPGRPLPAGRRGAGRPPWSAARPGTGRTTRARSWRPRR